MPVVQKIVSIDVQSNLSKFTEEFDRYNDLLSKQPEMWADVAKENKAMGEGFKVMAALMLAQGELARKAASEHKKIATESSAAAFSWSSMASSSKSVFNNIIGATRSLEKWTGIFTLASGLAVGGSLWGFDRFAASAGAGRREATGLGLSYGAKRAFGVTYGRFVDSDTLLHGVSTARGDSTSAEARAMFSLGMVPGQSGDTAESSLETLKRVRALAQRTPDHMLGTVSKAYGLDALGYGTEQMRRLKSASDQDIDEGGYKKRIQDFGVTEKALKDMQEFDMALESAGIKIKSTFIELLGPLAPELKTLVDGMSDAAKQFFSSQGFKDGIQAAARGLHEFGQYVNTPAFRQDLKTLTESVAYAAKKMVAAAEFIGLLPTKESEQDKKTREGIAALPPTVGGGPIGWLMNKFAKGSGGATSGSGGVKTLPDGTPITDTPPLGYSMAQDAKVMGVGNPINNPGNLRPVGGTTGFQQFATEADGIKAMSNNLLYYANKMQKDTLKDIISTWAPPSDNNNTQAYINNVSKWTGYDPNQHLNMNDPAVRANVMAAMTRQEGYGSNPSYSEGNLRVVIENRTGGSAVTSIATGGGVSGIGTPGPSILQ